MSKMYYGFLDESGILEKKAKEGRHFVVSVVVVGNPAELKDIVKLSKRRVRGKFKTHAIFHAYKENEGFVKIVLGELTKGNVGIIVGVWDKRKKKPRVSKNVLYGKLVAQTAKLALAIYPKLNLTLHKRYNDPEIINQINNELGSVVKSGQALFVDHKPETVRKELELADAVAWAVFQKYSRKRGEFYEIIKERIKKESRLAA